MSKENFKILSPREHVRERVGMYLGSASSEKISRFVMGKWTEIEYVPALLKMVDEIIDNSIDEALRTKFEYANEIDVSITKSTVRVSDNGRGIPQDKVLDEESGESYPRPVAAWTRVNAGTSFTSDRTTIGANGVGSACVNFMSSEFAGLTRDGKREVHVKCANGAKGIDFSTRKCSLKSGTSVEFTPDFELLECHEITDEIIQLTQDRLWSLQMSFPEIKFTFNKKRIGQPKIKKYAEVYNDKFVAHQSDDLSFFFTTSDDGWRTNSYVNGVHTRSGGSYVDVIANEVAEPLMRLIKRRHKIDVSKQQVKQGLTLVMFARNFVNPKFDSQTKERLTNTWGECKKHAGDVKWDALARRIADTPEIIDPIIEAQLAKKIAAEKRAATLAQKKAQKKNPPKHKKATSRGGTCFICEGDSAIGFLMSVRDRKKHGGFPLRGVIMNTWDKTPAEILKNKELNEMIASLDLDITNPDSVDDMWYDRIGILVDADMDGSHIAALLFAFFWRWPRLFSEERIFWVRTPILIAKKGTDVKWFYTFSEANEFKSSSKSKGYYLRYIKGLASLEEEEYHEIINNPKADCIKVDDVQHFHTMFGDDVDPRKELLKGEVK